MYQLGQTLFTGVEDSGSDHLCTIILQGRSVQASSPVPEPAETDGSNFTISEICTPPHASHQVVPDAALEPCNAQTTPPSLCQQRPSPRTTLVGGQELPVTGNFVYLSHHHHHYHYRYEHGGVGGQCCMPRSGTALFNNLWTCAEHQLHINVLELRVVCLTFQHLEQELSGQTVLIESENTATMSYINKQGGVISKILTDEACTLYEWTIPRSIQLRAIHRPGINKLVDFLSRNRPDPTEWHLSPMVVHQLFQLWSRPQVDPFATHVNHQLPCWFCWTSHQLAADLQRPVSTLNRAVAVHLPSYALIKIREDQVEEVIVIAPSWPRSFISWCK